MNSTVNIIVAYRVTINNVLTLCAIRELIAACRPPAVDGCGVGCALSAILLSLFQYWWSAKATGKNKKYTVNLLWRKDWPNISKYLITQQSSLTQANKAPDSSLVYAALKSQSMKNRIFLDGYPIFPILVPISPRMNVKHRLNRATTGQVKRNLIPGINWRQEKLA